MQRFSRERCKKAADKFKALGHPVRRWIAQQLLDGEHCVRDFVELTDLDFFTISQHVATLKQAGIIADEKRRTYVFYCLMCECVRRFLECVAERMEKKLPGLF